MHRCISLPANIEEGGPGARDSSTNIEEGASGANDLFSLISIYGSHDDCFSTFSRGPFPSLWDDVRAVSYRTSLSHSLLRFPAPPRLRARFLLVMMPLFLILSRPSMLPSLLSPLWLPGYLPLLLPCLPRFPGSAGARVSAYNK